MSILNHTLTLALSLPLAFAPSLATEDALGRPPADEAAKPVRRIDDDPAVTAATETLRTTQQKAESAVERNRDDFRKLVLEIERAGGLEKLSADDLAKARKRLIDIARGAEETAEAVQRQEAPIRGAIRTLVDRSATIAARWEAKAERLAEDIARIKENPDLSEKERKEFVESFVVVRSMTIQQVDALRGVDAQRGDLEKRLNSAFTRLGLSRRLLQATREVLEGGGDAARAVAQLESLVRQIQELSLGAAEQARKMAEIFEAPQP